MLEFKKEIKILEAKTFFQRVFGLMFLKNIKYGLLFKKCMILHTFFMRTNIDIVAIDKNNNIIKTFYNIKPNKIIKGPKETYSMCEFPTGYIK